jgi:maltose-binding protein MalE
MLAVVWGLVHQTRIALAVLVVLAPGCSSRAAPEGRARVRLWHAFNAGEAAALNQALETWQAEQRIADEPVKETFARGQTMLRRVLETGTDCPDLARIDATWLPGLVSAGLVQRTPASVGSDRRWLPAAAALVDGERYGLAQAIDGLALVYREQVIEAPGEPVAHAQP